MKTCLECKVEKPTTEFYRRTRRDSQVFYSYCKPCHGKRSQDSGRRNAHKYVNRHRTMNITKHGITEQQYEDLLAAQEGLCGICGELPDAKRLHVDHNHACCPGPYSCGKCVRGLLCFRCNVGLGNFGDDVDRLSSAMFYLLFNEKYPMSSEK